MKPQLSMDKLSYLLFFFLKLHVSCRFNKLTACGGRFHYDVAFVPYILSHSDAQKFFRLNSGTPIHLNKAYAKHSVEFIVQIVLFHLIRKVCTIYEHFCHFTLPITFPAASKPTSANKHISKIRNIACL